MYTNKGDQMATLHEFILDAGDSVYDAITNEFDSQAKEYPFKFRVEEENVGNIYIRREVYIDEECENEFRDKLSKEFTEEKLFEILKNNKDFKKSLCELAQKIVKEREI